MEAIAYLIIVFATGNKTIAVEKIPQSSLAKCENNGYVIADSFKDVKWKCITGVKG